jgi:MFS family permease
MIPFRHRGMYQAMQNILVGFGAISAASLGGIIAEGIGWRWCFLLQVPVSLLALGVGWVVLENPTDIVLEYAPGKKALSALKYLDISGAFILVLGLGTQLVGLSFGGNEYAWNSVPVVGSLVASVFVLVLFVNVEATTAAIPVIPLRMLRGWQPVAVQLTNLFSGMAAYAVSSIFPIFPHPIIDQAHVVSLHDPIVLPSCSRRLSDGSRHSTDSSISRDPNRRCDSGFIDASRVSSLVQRSHGHRHDASWKCSCRDDEYTQLVVARPLVLDSGESRVGAHEP